MELTREVILKCWDDCHELDRNRLLEMVRELGGVTPIPAFIPSSPSHLNTFGEFILTVIRTMEHIQEASRGTWVGYIDVPSRMFTIAPKEWVQMAVEEGIINRRLQAVTG